MLYGFLSMMAFWQEEKARFEVFPFENEIKNRSWTRTMIHSANLAIFLSQDSPCKLCYVCERIIIIIIIIILLYKQALISDVINN